MLEQIHILIMIVVGVIGIATPLFKLNSSISKLTILIERLEADYKKHDKRLNRHSDKLEKLGNRVSKLEIRKQNRGNKNGKYY